MVTLAGRTLADHSYPIEAAANARTPVAEQNLSKLAAGHTVLVVLKVSDEAGAPVSDNFYWWSAEEASLRELNSLARRRI